MQFDLNSAMNMRQPLPDVLLVVPALNEARFIGDCVRSLIQQDYEGRLLIAVYDGGSTDDTVELARAMETADRVIVRDNPGRTQSAALNLAARSDLAGEILMRADAHSEYKPDFVSTCIKALLAEDADTVVVPMQTVGLTPFQRAAAAAQNSLLGNGGSAHRRNGRSRFVDHGHHAAFRRDFFMSVGGYSLDFTHNEDAEFDYRARARGGRIWLCCEAMITYYPRASLGALARQYVNYGRGRARNLLRHGARPKVRQLAPLIVTATGGLGLIVAPVLPYAVLVPTGYIAIYGGWSIAAALRSRDSALLAMGLAAIAMHVSWSVGFAKEVVDRVLAKDTVTCPPTSRPKNPRLQKEPANGYDEA